MGLGRPEAKEEAVDGANNPSTVPDRNKINLSDDVVARHWAKKLGKSKEEIAVAIEKVGNNCESVRKELGCEPSSE